MRKPVLTIEKYVVNIRTRDRSDHMENRNNDSVWSYRPQDRWRVKLGKKVLSEFFFSEDTARKFVAATKKWHSLDRVRREKKEAKENLTRAIESAKLLYVRDLRRLDRESQLIRRRGFR